MENGWIGSEWLAKGAVRRADLDVIFLCVLVGVFALFLRDGCVIRRGNGNIFLFVVCSDARCQSIVPQSP